MISNYTRDCKVHGKNSFVEEDKNLVTDLIIILMMVHQNYF